MAPGLVNDIVRHRITLAALGGVSALSLWMLGRLWGQALLPPALYLALFSFVAVYSAVALALCGPVTVRRALSGALYLALPATVLISLAGFRQVVATDLLDEPVLLSVIVIFVFFSTPFLLVWLCDRGKWRDYSALFDAAWSMVVRYSVAWGFVAVFWLLVLLSDALLELVGIQFVDRLLRIDPMRFGLSGAMLGLGLAVVYELRQTLSPYLFLRLLRLLVPPVLAVVAVFLLGVPFRGLTDLFGEFSSAATLMGAAIVSITLVSAALDRDDDNAVSTAGLRAATRGLAGLLPFLTGLAVWAVVLRVRQYGWTPDRLLAASVALFLLAYGIGYAVSALRGQGWAARVRQVNMWMALAVVLVAALWLTPVVDAYRISSNSQIGRYLSGQSGIDELPIWALHSDWGRAGRAALIHLESGGRPGDREELDARIASARKAQDRFRFEQALREREAPDRAATLADLMPVRPADVSLTAADLKDVPHFRIAEWTEGCRRSLPDGRPGCVFVEGQFSPHPDAIRQGMVLFLSGQGGTRAHHLRVDAEGHAVVSDVYEQIAGTWPELPGSAVSDALDGAFSVAPSGGNALFIDGSVLVPQF